MKRRARGLVVFGVVGTITASLISTGVPLTAAPRNTPGGEILVVTQNLEEAYSAGRGDLGSNWELDNFAKRVKAIVPQVPDVVLLQEVNYETSAVAARRLSARLGQRFVVAVRPIKNTTVEFPAKQVHTETAILINKKTMATKNGGGYMLTTYPRSVSAGGARVDERKHAFMLARERGTNVELPLVSLHFAREASFKTLKQSNYYRGKWSRQIKNELDRRYNIDSSQKVAVVGGDFNMGRCYRGALPDCPKADYFKVFVDSPHRYSDALMDVGFFPTGVDVLFGTGTALRGGRDDAATNWEEGARTKFYSDHILRWVVIEPKVSA